MALIHIFGNRPIPKVLDFFTVNQFWDYSLKDISEETKVSYRTLQGIVPLLVKEGILNYTRTEGNAKLYRINKESNCVKNLLRISRESDFEYAERLLAKEKEEVPSPVAVI